MMVSCLFQDFFFLEVGRGGGGGAAGLVLGFIVFFENVRCMVILCSFYVFCFFQGAGFATFSTSTDVRFCQMRLS